MDVRLGQSASTEHYFCWPVAVDIGERPGRS